MALQKARSAWGMVGCRTSLGGDCTCLLAAGRRQEAVPMRSSLHQTGDADGACKEKVGWDRNGLGRCGGAGRTDQQKGNDEIEYQHSLLAGE